MGLDVLLHDMGDSGQARHLRPMHVRLKGWAAFPGVEMQEAVVLFTVYFFN